MTDDTQVMGTQCFISYTRADNDGFNRVVDRLRTDLAGRFEATTGRTLQIFLDRESIGWGQDWRNNIRGSIESATFFLPVVTMRYFDSGPCREELIAFYENAKQLGVTELIIPVILAGSSQISADDAREEVRIIERLNYRNIEEAWLDGYDSPAWLRMVHLMVRDLHSALQEAEAAISAREQQAIVPGDDALDEEDVSILGVHFDDIGVLSTEVARVWQEFEATVGRVFEADGVLKTTAKQRQVHLVQAARGIGAQAQELASVGARFEQKVVEVDAQLRAVIFDMRDIKLAAAEERVDSLVDGLSGVQSLNIFMPHMDDIVSMLRLAALNNVSLRKSVQPAIKGIRSIRNGLSTAQSWRNI